MTKTTMIHARVPLDLKEDVAKILKELGLSATEAITLFYSQVKLRKGLPFPVQIPNKETLKG
jgi:DNA-damage-inducible protein J